MELYLAAIGPEQLLTAVLRTDARRICSKDESTEGNRDTPECSIKYRPLFS